MDKETILEHYIICALWSSIDEDGNPLDDNFSDDDLAQSARQKMADDVADFVNANSELLEASGLSDAQIGHDFWLTRNGHGAGFWDRGLGDIGNKLSEAARVYREQDIYVGDDGKLYIL